MTKEEVDAAVAALESWGRSIDTWVLICAVFVALFLAAEAALGVTHWINEKHLRPLRESQANFREKELLALGKAADEAKERAAKAELALKNFKEPRDLPEPKQRLIARELRHFSGTIFDTGAAEADPEYLSLLAQLINTLKLANWTPVDWRGPGLTIGGRTPVQGLAGVVGVGIFVNPKASSNLWSAAQFLAKTLRENTDFAVNSGQMAVSGNTNDAAIHVMVGRKQ